MSLDRSLAEKVLKPSFSRLRQFLFPPGFERLSQGSGGLMVQWKHSPLVSKLETRRNLPSVRFYFLFFFFLLYFLICRLSALIITEAFCVLFVFVFVNFSFFVWVCLFCSVEICLSLDVMPSLQPQRWYLQSASLP